MNNVNCKERKMLQFLRLIRPRNKKKKKNDLWKKLF